MIEHATKAAYDHHHPGAHPCPCPVEGRHGRGDGEVGDGFVNRVFCAVLTSTRKRCSYDVSDIGSHFFLTKF